LNTSFNDNGEPIVETPIDALLCFMRTHMDYLVLEGFLVDKRALTDSQRSELVVRISQLRDQRLKEDYQRALQQLCRGYNAAEMRRYLRQEKDRATYHLNYKAYDRLEEKIVECCERGLSVSILCDREHGRIFKKLEASHCLRISSEIVIVDDHESLRGCDLKGLFPADVVIVALFNMAFRAEEALRSMWDGDIYMVYDRYTRKITCACELLDFQQDRNTVHDLHLHSAEYNGNCDWDKYFCSLDDVSRDDYTNTEI
jgi:carbamoyltransferase